MASLGTELLIHQLAELKPALQQALHEVPEGGTLALDCAELADIDGAGLQMLVVLARTLQRRGASLALVGCSGELRRRIADTALDVWFSFEAGLTAREAA